MINYLIYGIQSTAIIGSIALLLLINDMILIAWRERRKPKQIDPQKMAEELALKYSEKASAEQRYRKQQCEKGNHDFGKWSKPYDLRASYSGNGHNWRQKRECYHCHLVDVSAELYGYIPCEHPEKERA